MNKKKLSHSGSLQSSVTSVLAALLCILIGLLVGFLVLVAINPAHAWGDGFVRIIKGGFHDAPYGVGKELANAAPLIMTGLSVAFAFKTGLFNIGAAGQYTLGAYGALYCALVRLPAGSSRAGRPVGRDPRFLQGLLQHQRGHYLHYVQLDRPVSGE